MSEDFQGTTQGLTSVCDDHISRFSQQHVDLTFSGCCLWDSRGSFWIPTSCQFVSTVATEHCECCYGMTKDIALLILLSLRVKGRWERGCVTLRVEGLSPGAESTGRGLAPQCYRMQASLETVEPTSSAQEAFFCHFKTGPSSQSRRVSGPYLSLQ